jgi:hypothetical protein
MGRSSLIEYRLGMIILLIFFSFFFKKIKCKEILDVILESSGQAPKELIVSEIGELLRLGGN